MFLKEINGSEIATTGTTPHREPLMSWTASIVSRRADRIGVSLKESKTYKVAISENLYGQVEPSENPLTTFRDPLDKLKNLNNL